MIIHYVILINHDKKINRTNKFNQILIWKTPYILK